MHAPYRPDGYASAKAISSLDQKMTSEDAGQVKALLHPAPNYPLLMY
jgi:hypothetical protein